VGRLLLLSALILAASPAPARPDLAARTKGPPVRISGVLFDGSLKGNPEPESSIRLTNTSGKTINIGGFGLTDRYTPGKNTEEIAVTDNVGKRTRRPGPNRVHLVRIPEGTKLGPHQEIWVAHEAEAFELVYGHKPDFETTDTDPKVKDLDSETGWLFLAAKHGSVALVDSGGEVVDFVAYDRNKVPRYTADELPDRYWSGPPVRLYKSSYYGWTNQILSRDRDERRRLLPDTNTAADWDSGNSKKQLGEEPTHRIELPGQSTFRVRKLKGVKATVLATSAPDNNFGALIAAFNGAKKEIRVSVYQLTNPKVADALEAALRRGVKVWCWMEGAPVGGIPDQERYLLDRLARAGAEVYFLASLTKQKVKARYRFDHSKYVLIDDHTAIIGTENYGRTGVPIVNSFGNRGWMVHVQHPTFVKQLREVWDHDLRPGVFRDTVHIDDKPNDPYGLPYRKPDFEPDFTVVRGFYPAPKKPLKIREKMDLELVLAPDTSLNENSALIGMMNRARKTLYVEQNSIRRKWGRKDDKIEDTPDLPFQAIINAARRGVKTRVLLDGTWYNITGDDDRDNDDVARMLNDIARKEGLDLSAKVINLKAANLVKIHTKGIIVDEKDVFVGSINWTENSFKGNREVGVVITNKKIAGYYADLFKRDWSESRMYSAPAKKSVRVRSRPSGKSRAIGQIKKGKPIYVVGEHGGNPDSGHAWVEVRLQRGKTAFVHRSALGPYEATPHEALHLLGRKATVQGRVAMTKVSDKVIQLRFEDDERPPFVAVIFRSSEAKFRARGISPASAFQGREVRVTGTVQSWLMPEIIISNPDQIEIVR
jgi:phosphatidylserine/phosphatidylglycerophosphate/cardiolipin synthase-like enzyme